MTQNNFSKKEAEKFQEILTERSKLQASIGQEEKEKSQLQFRLNDLVKNFNEIIISISQRKFIIEEYDQLILKAESTLHKMSDDLEALLDLLKTALAVELERPKIYSNPNCGDNISECRNPDQYMGKMPSLIVANDRSYEHQTHRKPKMFRPANGL